MTWVCVYSGVMKDLQWLRHHWLVVSCVFPSPPPFSPHHPHIVCLLTLRSVHLFSVTWYSVLNVRSSLLRNLRFLTSWKCYLSWHILKIQDDDIHKTHQSNEWLRWRLLTVASFCLYWGVHTSKMACYVYDVAWPTTKNTASKYWLNSSHCPH